MMTVKEMKELLATANDNDYIAFYGMEDDRDGYTNFVQLKVKNVKTVSLTDEEVKKFRWWGY